MRASAWAAAMLLASWSQSAAAAPIRVDFAGTIGSVQGSVLSAPAAEAALGGSLHGGTPFSGYVVFEDSTTPFPADDSLYDFAPPYVVHTELGSYVSDSIAPPVAGSHFLLRVRKDLTLGSAVAVYANDAAAPSSGTGLYLIDVFVFLGQPSLQPFDFHSLAELQWDLATFPNATVSWDFKSTANAGPVEVIASGTITSLSAHVVPEPAAGLLALAAAVCFLSARCGASSKT